MRVLAPHSRPRARAGITLTEILISIMIMGVGLLSLATLFPLGLIRIRDAARSSRSALLTQSAEAELWGRGMLYKPSFSATWYGQGVRGVTYDPFRYDPVNPNNPGQPFIIPPVLDGGVYRTVGAGLPVCYDPLWWYEIALQSNGGTTPVTTAASASQGRFAYGLGFIRDDPGGGVASAHGLQRLTNFPYYTTGGAYNLPINVEAIFASADDIVFQASGPPNVAQGLGNPLAPDFSSGGPVADLSYTWFFTGTQTDVTNGQVFDGDIVICHNRPFGYETTTAPDGSQYPKATDETVVEAVWGYGPPQPLFTGATVGYAVNTHTVLLRWSADMPDPDVRVGGWIADVTYERSVANLSRFAGLYPGQRCHWYRVVKRTESTEEAGGAFRRMTVTLATPVRARTLLNMSDGMPAHVEAALIMPSVVNVYSKTFITR